MWTSCDHLLVDIPKTKSKEPTALVQEDLERNQTITWQVKLLLTGNIKMRQIVTEDIRKRSIEDYRHQRETLML